MNASPKPSANAHPVPEALSRAAFLDFQHLLAQAEREDLGDEGDVTSTAIFGTEEAEAYIMAREDLRLAGLRYAREVFLSRDRKLRVEVLKQDGSDVMPGDKVLSVTGPVRSMLEVERIALNFMAYLTGIATRTDI